jgi:hypothetical protein
VASRNEILFPPQPDHEHEWQSLVGVLASVVDGPKADYVSTPITTGRRFLDWYRGEGQLLGRDSDAYRRAHEMKVIRPNGLDAKRFAERLRHEGRLVIEPTSLHLPLWTQNDYRHLWGRVIERYVRRVVLLDGWQLSSGCSYEFFVAAKYGVECVTQDFQPINRSLGTEMIAEAIVEMQAIEQGTLFLLNVIEALRSLDSHSKAPLLKDEALDRRAATANVAQFVSFAPGDVPQLRFCRIDGFGANHRFQSPEEAIHALLAKSPEGLVRVRSFKPGQAQSMPFTHEPLASEREIVPLVRQWARDGLFTIVNEAIDTHDGGVSGVLAGSVIEFAPDDTPRCVELPGVAMLPTQIALKILETVYRCRPSLFYTPLQRIEFTICLQRRGVWRENTILWEIGPLDAAWVEPKGDGNLAIGAWPHRFSQFLGDKLFGLLIANALGFDVPRAQAIHRRIPAFSFGRSTESSQYWLRSAPGFRAAGKYPTYFDRGDPFEMMSQLPATVPSIIVQECVRSLWSGSLNTERTGPRIEGVEGFADKLMLGKQSPATLPDFVTRPVLETYRRLAELLGPVSMEWAYDGETVWLLQLHKELSISVGTTIVPGEPTTWIDANAADGLESLEQRIEAATNAKSGIRLHGTVGMTSHIAEVLRKAGVPSRMA